MQDQLETSEQGREAALAQLADASARAERAEASIAGERQRTDALRERLDLARAETQAAQNAAEELRQAEAGRKARGRMRRAWDGWRGK